MDALDLPVAQSVLVVIDVQEKLVAAMPSEAGSRAVAATCTLVRGARRLGVPVLVTEQYPKGLGPTDPKLRDALETYTAIEKLEFDATANARFDAALRALGRSAVVLAGMESHICVYQTARGLARRGVHVHVAADATCARTADNDAIAHELWRRAGAVVTSTEAVLFDWVGRAGTEEFKAVSRLVK
jgi:nicotinamidase-related amidase